MRTDRNQAEIVRAFETCGATVVHIHATKGGCPDLLIGFQGRNYLAEVKVPKDGRLSDVQKEWRDHWNGGKPFVIRDTDDVVRLIGLIQEAR